MERLFPRIKNYNVSVREVDGKVIFLRKLMPGGSEHSFGIHVAEIAGMPKSIVQRANEILKQLEADNAQVGALEQDGLAATAGNGSAAGAGGSANNGSAGNGSSATGAKAAIKPKASNAPTQRLGSSDAVQLSFFQLDDPVLSQIRDEIVGLDINNLTPMEALNKLNDIKTIVGGK